MPGGRWTTPPLSNGAAVAGPCPATTAAAARGGQQQPPQAAIAAAAAATGAATAARDRRPASAAPQTPTGPEAFWDLFYSRTTRKMLEDAAEPAQTTRATAPRPVTPSPAAPKKQQERQSKKAAWVWLDSQSSLDTPCPKDCKGCLNNSEEKPYDADSSGVSSQEGFQVGASPCLFVRGAPLTQQQLQQQQPARIRVAGPVEANGRPPLLFDDSVPAEGPAFSQGAESNRPPQQQQQQQQQQQLQQSQFPAAPAGEQTGTRRKRRSGRRRSSGRRRN